MRHVYSILILAVFLASLLYPVATASAYKLFAPTVRPETIQDVPSVASVQKVYQAEAKIDKFFKEYVIPDKVIVVYKKGSLRIRANIIQIDRLNYQFGFKTVKRLKHLSMDIVKLPANFQVKSIKDLAKLQGIYSRLPFVKAVYPVLKFKLDAAEIKLLNGTVVKSMEPNGLYDRKVFIKKPEASKKPEERKQVSLNLNDEFASWLWNLEFVHAPEAWNYTTGSPDIVVAVIDTGITPHLDLAKNIWINHGEIPFNNKDDDGDGYIDDIYGYDFAEDDPWPFDTVGHGTFVAGIIAAAANNSIGVAGVAPNVKVMALKVSYDDAWWLAEDAILEAMDYVIAMKQRGVNIVAVSASWGAEWIIFPLDVALKYFEAPLYNAIAELYQNGILFVNAAGNAAALLDSDWFSDTPAEYGLPNIIVVGSIGPDGTISWFSNFGYKGVDVMAPGEDVVSTFGIAYDDGFVEYIGYAIGSGTSFATPHVSATAALIASLYKKLGLNVTNLPMAIKMAILFSSSPVTKNLYNETVSVEGFAKAGYLDVYRALELVAKQPDKLDMLLLEPAPYVDGKPNMSWFTVDTWWTADVLPANASIVFKVLLGTPTGPVKNLEVKVVDGLSGKTVGVLRDDGQYPDQFAGDGVYTGYVTLPANKNAVGRVELRNLTLIAVNTKTSDNVLEKTYTFKVFNTPATYSVKASDKFLWIDMSKVPATSYDFFNWLGVLEQSDIPVFGVPASQLVADNLSVYKKYAWNGTAMAPAAWWRFVLSPELVLGADVFAYYVGEYSAWICSCANEPLVEPMNAPGVAATISLISTPSDPFSLDYDDWAAWLGSQLAEIKSARVVIDGVNATVFYYYNPEPYPPVEAELIVFDNGTIAMSYKSAPLTEDSIAFVALNKWLSAVFNLASLAPNESTLVGKTIVFQPVLVAGVPPAPAFSMEQGIVSVSHVPKFVEFSENYTNPVVVVGPPTYRGAQPAISYVLDVNATGFKVALKEWNYLDGAHIAENVSYLVVEAGVHRLGDGRTIEAGYANASTKQWTWISFPEKFDTVPVVVASIASDTGNITVTVRIKDVNATGFWALLQPQESLKGKVDITARISWIAVEPGVSKELEAGFVETPSGSNPSVTVQFNNTYTKLPAVLASIVTFNGADPVILRVTKLTTTSVTLMMQEDQSADKETYHLPEKIAYIVLPIK